MLGARNILPICFVAVASTLSTPVLGDEELDRIDKKRRLLLERIENFVPPKGGALILIGHGNNLSELYKDLFMLDYDDPRKPLGAALAMKGVSDEQIIEILFETVVRRKQKRDEFKNCIEHMAKKKTERKDAVHDIVWALCNSKEFIEMLRK